MKFEAYSVKKKTKVQFQVKKKIITNVRGHYTYTLMGESDDGTNISTLVNKSQWDKFDVPIEQRKIDKVIDRKYKRKQMLKPHRPPQKLPNKDKRKVYNEEIQRWLIQKYDLDLDEYKES